MGKKLLRWIPIVVWCSVIFYQSGKPGPVSVGESMLIVKVLNHWVARVAGPGVIVITDDMVRTAAHFFEYFMLACLLFAGFFDRTRLRRTIMASLIAGLLYAVSDEIHQNFVPGRHMRLIDLAVDSAGSMIGICVMIAARRTIFLEHRRKHERLSRSRVSTG